MGQKITLGGQRLGAGGNKIQQELHNYERSTHDLSESIVTSMSCGTLTPFMVKPVLRGDVFEIDTNAACRTIPTKGPLFGSYKLQGDFFFLPVRLYQALLHNNPTDIAQKMNQVMLPTITIKTTKGANEDKMRYGKFNLSSLMKYCGMSGLGRAAHDSIKTISREIQAIPMLGYYDIYKNFYANKQEESGKVISIGTNKSGQLVAEYVTATNMVKNGDTLREFNFSATNGIKPTCRWESDGQNENWTEENVKNIVVGLVVVAADDIDNVTFEELSKESKGLFKYNLIKAENKSILDITISEPFSYKGNQVTAIYFNDISTLDYKQGTQGLQILDFPLKNLDDMRYALLTHHQLGMPFKIGDNEEFDWHGTSGESGDGLPYSTLFNVDYEGKTANKYPMNGLCLKTYQNDIYNTWLNSEIIDGEGGVNDLTKVQVQDGAFMINALLYAEKLYELYNRIATTDGTYDSWLNVVYEQEDRISHEKPLYLGGFYNEIVFEEIVQSAPAGGEPLGELGGKGTLADKTKGGKVVFKAGEIGFIMGIVSITPRIYYTQQNEFYMTDIKSMDDFHKPALDQIGFQDLIGERLNFEDTILDGGNIVHRSKIGKLPAWLEYQTSVDKAFGDLAEPNGNGYMILNRNYETDDNGIIDATTYIDPTKYNYAFAYSALDSQNFWVQTRSKVIARRKMSANLLPNI